MRPRTPPPLACRVLTLPALALGSALAMASETPTDPGKPGFEGGSVSYHFRSFADVQDIEGVLRRHALTANLRVLMDSGLTPGPAGLGFNASLFVGTDLGSSSTAGNMAHIRTDWTRSDQPAWAYLGEYGVRLKGDDYLLRYGVQTYSNPYLESKDNRGLPPTFRGLAGVYTPAENWRVELGSVDSVYARGMAARTPLTTTYGNTPVRRLDFVGVAYEAQDGRSGSLYAAHAQDVWTQWFASGAAGVGDPQVLQLKGNVAAYFTRSTGRALQGRIHTNAYSLSLSPTRGPYSVTLGFQHIQGDQFFDYLSESWGIALANAYGADYNAPNERSLMLSFSLDGAGVGLAGLKATLWRGQGWGADASVGAQPFQSPDAALHALYWKQGQPVQGKHREAGLYLEYAAPPSWARELRLKLIAMQHWSTQRYSEDPFYEVKFTVDKKF